MESIEILKSKPPPAGFKIEELPAGEISDQEETQDQMWVHCRSCLHKIALQSDKINILNADNHIFENPAGIFYRLVCFSSAPGAVNITDYTDENTWFPGCLWSITLCRSCSNHLGWHYISESGDFFGLIADRLTGI
jgi:hypothetical protein